MVLPMAFGVSLMLAINSSQLAQAYLQKENLSFLLMSLVI
jgi:hypothetical protein